RPTPSVARSRPRRRKSHRDTKLCTKSGRLSSSPIRPKEAKARKGICAKARSERKREIRHKETGWARSDFLMLPPFRAFARFALSRQKTFLSFAFFAPPGHVKARRAALRGCAAGSARRATRVFLAGPA